MQHIPTCLLRMDGNREFRATAVFFRLGNDICPQRKCCWSTVLNLEGFNIANELPSPFSRLGRAWHQPGFELSAAEKVAYCRKLEFSNDILLGSDNRRSDPPFKVKFLDMSSRKAGWENVSKEVWFIRDSTTPSVRR